MLLEIFIIALAIPAGFLISWMARDELIVGKKWFIVLIVLFTASGVIAIVFKQPSAAFTSFFIAIISAVAFWKSGDKKWTKKL